MKVNGTELYDGLHCADCDWCGPFDKCSMFNGELACGNFMCCSANVTEVYLCECGEAPQWDDEGRCIECAHNQPDDPDPFDGDFRRDQQDEIKPLVRT